MERETIDGEFARARRIEAADEVLERAFSAAARAGDGDEIEGRDFERDVVERGNAAVAAGDVAEADQGS